MQDAAYGFRRESVNPGDGKTVNASERQRGDDLQAMKEDIAELKREILDLKKAVDLLTEKA